MRGFDDLSDEKLDDIIERYISNHGRATGCDLIAGFLKSVVLRIQRRSNIPKTRASCFIRGSKHRETDKSTRPQAECFYCFEVFGTPDETRSTSFWYSFLNELPIIIVCKQ